MHRRWQHTAGTALYLHAIRILGAGQPNTDRAALFSSFPSPLRQCLYKSTTTLNLRSAVPYKTKVVSNTPSVQPPLDHLTTRRFVSPSNSLSLSILNMQFNVILANVLVFFTALAAAQSSSASDSDASSVASAASSAASSVASSVASSASSLYVFLKLYYII